MEENCLNALVNKSTSQNDKLHITLDRYVTLSHDDHKSY